MLFGGWGDSIALGGIFVVSAIEVGFCAWVMDKCNVTKKVWFALLISIGVGVVEIQLRITNWGTRRTLAGFDMFGCRSGDRVSCRLVQTIVSIKQYSPCQDCLELLLFTLLAHDISLLFD